MCGTGERAVLDARQAARLLVVLAADLMEQDAFFSLHLPCACLRLASPHLQVPPPLWQRLEDSGVFPYNSHSSQCNLESKTAGQKMRAAGQARGGGGL